MIFIRNVAIDILIRGAGSFIPYVFIVDGGLIFLLMGIIRFFIRLIDTTHFYYKEEFLFYVNY